MTTQASGKVYLVGAGPGDPELLTVRALRILQQADVVLHDELVSPEILELVPPSALLRSVGKRCGTKTFTQEAINTLMVDCALSGRIVIRLKGGDPMIFGRADEELAALQSAGIAVEVVPGITATLGVAAAAQMPLTQRYLSSAVVLTTFCRAANQPPMNWRQMIAAGVTIVLYMPGGNYHKISQELRQAGLPGETPCVIASQASTPREVLLATTVEQLPQLAPLASPTLLVLGPIARFSKPTALEHACEAAVS